jgi:hypothetical protein
MAKVSDIVEMWQGSQYLCAIQKDTCTENKQMTATGYIAGIEEIINKTWSLFQDGGVAAFKLLK